MPPMNLVLPNISPDVNIRLMPGTNKLHVVDFIMAVCNCPRDKASVMLHNAQDSKDYGVLARSVLREESKYKFPGQGQRAMYVFDIEEAIIFLDCLPHRHTGDIKQYIRTQFLRVTAGDPMLLAEVERNAQSNGFLQQASRERLNLPVATAVVVQPATAVITNEPCPTQKRRREELELEAMALANQATASENKKLHAEMLTATKLAYENCLGGPAIEDRDRMRIHDMMRSEIFGQPHGQQQKLITNGTDTNENEEFTAEKLIVMAGYKIVDGLSSGLGRVLAAKYRDMYNNRDPLSCNRWFDGAQRVGFYYLAKDKEWLLEETARYCAAHSKAPPPGQRTLAGFVTRTGK